MARYEDYVNRGQAGGLQNEISDAQQQQQARQEDATPAVDWEQRYRELEQLNSRQAQTLGDYRKTIDNFITNPTPAPAPQEIKPQPITVDEFYEDPDAVLNRAVESHPAIQEAREIKQSMEQRQIQDDLNSFAVKHPDWQDLGGTPEFQNWVAGNPTRSDLFQRGNDYDFNAADALFSLYKAEKGMTQVQAANDIAQQELVSSSAQVIQDEPRMSRHEYIDMVKRSKQGDLNAVDWIKRNSAKYRMALQTGNVRD
jgi:hypothetical protein